MSDPGDEQLVRLTEVVSSDCMGAGGSRCCRPHLPDGLVIQLFAKGPLWSSSSL